MMVEKMSRASNDNPETEVPAKPQRSRHPVLWTLGVLLLLMLTAAGIGIWYLSTPEFANKVRLKVIAELEDATGGRVELQGFRWNLRYLEFEADGLTIHGLEAPSEVPYAHVEQLRIRLRILSLLHPAAHLELLVAEHPVFHLIVYPDGSTNQPKPKKAAGSLHDTINTIFDLQANRVVVRSGLVLLNQKALPFNVAADDVSLLVRYVGMTDRYDASVTVDDLTTQFEKEAEVHSHLVAEMELARGAAEIRQLEWMTKRSDVHVTGTVKNYEAPVIEARVTGTADLRDIAFLTAQEELVGGVASFDLAGQLTSANDFHADGSLMLKRGAYHDQVLDLANVDLTTPVHLTPTEIALPDVRVQVLSGGIKAEFHYFNWLNAPVRATRSGWEQDGGGAAGTTVKRVSRRGAAEARKKADDALPRGQFSADLWHLELKDVLRALVPRQYSELGFNTAATGHAEGGWRGNSKDVWTSAQLTIEPAAGASGVPVKGTVDATFDAWANRVYVRGVDAKTPGSTIQAQGVLDVARVNRGTSLQVTATTTNLAEFDQTLETIGLGAGSKQAAHPTQTLPVSLHGEAEFRGKVYGPLQLLRVAGHADVTNFDTLIPVSNGTATVASAAQTRELQWDELHTDVDISPAAIGVKDLSLKRGNTIVHATATLTADPAGGVADKDPYKFDAAAGIQGKADIDRASLTDLESIAGEQNLPVTGTLTLHVQVNGKLNDIQGDGHLAIQGGTIYGEPYRSLTADLTGNHTEVGVKNLVFLENGGRVEGSGGYDIGAKTMHGEVTGSRFELAHMQQLQKGNQRLGGALSFHLQVTGQLASPNIAGNLELAKVTLGKETLGSFQAQVHTQARTVFLTASSDLLQSHFALNGQVALEGDYETQANLTFHGLDARPLLRLYAPRAAAAATDLGGTVTLRGPLGKPKALDVEANLDTFKFLLSPVALTNDGPLKFSVDDGAVKIDQFKIHGPDSNLTAHGEADLTGQRKLDMHVDGDINLQLAQSFSSNIVSNGRAILKMDAAGTLDTPALHGQLKFENGTMAYINFPNGLSQLNGTLDFNEDRLEVHKLTAVTGGGVVTLGGSLTYDHGFYADLTAKAKDVRVRYPQGVSSTADGDLHLQGSPDASTLTGNIVLTRFGLTGILGLAGGAAGTVAAPPDPNSPLSKVQLDVHLTSAPSLSFENTYASIAGEVDLRIRGSMNAPSVLGRVSITQGTANLAGTTYQLDRGDVYFANPVRIDPLIDLDATAQVRDYDISVGIHGTIENLTTTYRSEPPLSQTDIIALLALGRTQEQSQIYQSEQSAAGVNSTTNALLGGALNATVSNRVQKLFGVGQVKIDPNFVGALGQSTPRVTVQQQVSKDITLTYATNVNETTQQLIQAQIAITRQVSLIAVRDEAGVFSLLIKIRQRHR
jgi:translocation and assembly module TamB